jgi:hypothetical protein
MQENKATYVGSGFALILCEIGITTMKTTLLVLVMIFCAATAFGQVGGVISSQPVVITIPDHPQHAGYQSMASEKPLVGGSSDTYSYAQGERPLWEFGPVSEPTPLGDVARAYRKEKQASKKAEFVLEKQGS